MFLVVLACPPGELLAQSAAASIVRLDALADELVRYAPGMDPSDLGAIRSEALAAHASALAYTDPVLGSPPQVAAPRAALRIANLLYHRHRDPQGANAILAAIRAGYQANPLPAFQAAAAGISVKTTATAVLPPEFKPHREVIVDDKAETVASLDDLVAGNKSPRK